MIEVAPGILWTRIPLPFRLDHVNIYLIEDQGGWAVLDAGIGDDVTRAAWEALVAGPLAGKRLTRLIVTHFHPDHIGSAGWLCERFDIPLLTSQTAYLGCINISLSPGALDAKSYHDFYARHGLDPATTALVGSDGHRYLKMVTKLPPTFTRVVAGDILTIGGREFRVLSGDDHAPEQLMLHGPSENAFLAADQVIARITPNVSVWAVDPEGDPLGLYLRSLENITRNVPDEVLVLPGHQLPFHGLHERCRQLTGHHQERCNLIETACRQKAHTVADLVPVLFPRPLDPHQLGFAFSEVHAHVNSMLRLGKLTQRTDSDGTVRVTV
ncbi:MBL fold metallo-hydrolase [Chelativorans sp. AA-79]|uniref:MBL fold metallo-hydrolase n=1 Tax=Chelativorans sp. AA-79 TaxID=3028735 RepID=UPI0023F75D03|nr:MBL fold metallo-hydrolase [Chelativorans sp. AA-79]WEX12244.1 MBL fold metallo-hydrolase [Chelativorans sp. AA-79]